jgi:hypothetical protein
MYEILKFSVGGVDVVALTVVGADRQKRYIAGGTGGFLGLIGHRNGGYVAKSVSVCLDESFDTLDESVEWLVGQVSDGQSFRRTLADGFLDLCFSVMASDVPESLSNEAARLLCDYASSC